MLLVLARRISRAVAVRVPYVTVPAQPATTLEPTEQDTSLVEESGELEENKYYNPLTGEEYGPRGPEPTRFGDWERNGRCYDF